MEYIQGCVIFIYRFVRGIICNDGFFALQALDDDDDDEEAESRKRTIHLPTGERERQWQRFCWQSSTGGLIISRIAHQFILMIIKKISSRGCFIGSLLHIRHQQQVLGFLCVFLLIEILLVFLYKY